MRGLTKQERIEDIKRRTGLDEIYVRSVLDALLASVEDSLKRGEATVISGLCTLEPMLKSNVIGTGINGQYDVKSYIDIRVKSSLSLKQRMKNYENFEEAEEPEYAEDIIVGQIAALT